jgi:hypothetical protein
MTYTGQEKRKQPRIEGRFVVAYRILEDKDNVDISQTKNLGLGGMLLTTNRYFDPGTNLAIEIRLPFDPNPIMLLAKVLESCEITKNLIYDTRLAFLSVDQRHKKVITETVIYYLKKG